MQDISAANPRRRQLGSALRAIERASRTMTVARGRAPGVTVDADLPAAIGEAATLVADLAAAFGVDLDGDGPASSGRQLGPEPPPAPPPSVPKPMKHDPTATRQATVIPGTPPSPSGARRRASRRPEPFAGGDTPERRKRPRDRKDNREPRRPAGAATKPLTEPVVAGPSPREATSTAFWSLMDGWKVGDQEALGLIGHRGGLTKQGTRPRFRVTGGEAIVFAALQEIDGALTTLGEEPARWLRRRARSGTARSSTPLDRIGRKGRAGADEVLREIAMLSLKRSL